MIDTGSPDEHLVTAVTPSSSGAQPSSSRFSPTVGEPDDGLGLVAVALDVEDHALAPLGVATSSPIRRPSASAPLGAGPPPAHGRLHDAVAACRARGCRRPLPTP